MKEGLPGPRRHNSDLYPLHAFRLRWLGNHLGPNLNISCTSHNLQIGMTLSSLTIHIYLKSVEFYNMFSSIDLVG